MPEPLSGNAGLNHLVIQKDGSVVVFGKGAEAGGGCVTARVGLRCRRLRGPAAEEECVQIIS